MRSPAGWAQSAASAVAADPQQSTRYPAFRVGSSFLLQPLKLLSLSRFWSREVAKVPLVGLAGSWREAWNRSAASLRCCPSPALVQDFRALSPLSQPSSAPWVTLETALSDWWPEGEWWAGKAMGREQVA